MQTPEQAKIEFGDFQTPGWFCEEICNVLVKKDIEPSSILEPTCGQGNFLLAALDYFPSTRSAIGIDINSKHIEFLQQRIASRPDKEKVEIFQRDFFSTDWQQILNNLPAPILILGNPPWVTNAQLSTIASNNTPKKNNFQNHAGIDAITGASNFDISEWMILKMLEWTDFKSSHIAVLCKTSVARRVLLHTWRTSSHVGKAQIIFIDSKKIFDAAVDACLLIYDASESSSKSCEIFRSLSSNSPSQRIGYRNRQIIANLEYFELWKHLQNKSKVSDFRWRSGIKHDCAKVMELEKRGEEFTNKLGESYNLEHEYIYPMLKSSDLANNGSKTNSRWMLVTQQSVGESTSAIKAVAPKTWRYLSKHSNYFAKRKSSIYKARPPFSIFGVGGYSFALWKVAISGLYKSMNFVVVGPHEEKPTVLDDTCYFLSCKNEKEAKLIADLLNSKIAQQFFQSFIFWDAKRPVTAKILNKLNIYALAEELDRSDELAKYSCNGYQAKQLRLLEKSPQYISKTTGCDPDHD